MVWCWKVPHVVVRRTLSRGKCSDSCEVIGVIRFLQTEEILLSCRRGKLSRGNFLLHDNARSHTARQTKALLRKQFHWYIFAHPPYSPDLAQSDFSCFQKWKSTLLLNASQMMKTWRMLSWPGWITRGPHGMKKIYRNWRQGMTSALMLKATTWKSKQRCVPKLVCSVSVLLLKNILVWRNVLYFMDGHRILLTLIVPRGWEIGSKQPCIKCHKNSATHFVYFWSRKTPLPPYTSGTTFTNY